MIRQLFPLLTAILFYAAVPLFAADKGFPSTSESLSYEIVLPTGLVAGTGKLDAVRGAGWWDFSLSLDASLPGVPVKDEFRSTSSHQLCSTSLVKQSEHGRRKTHETLTFDGAAGEVIRRTKDGGESRQKIESCAKDALTYLYFARQQFADGKTPKPETVIFGAAYKVRMEKAGKEDVTVGNKKESADRVVISFEGPASNASFELLLARDKARTPLLIRAPLLIGPVALRLVR